MLQSVRVSVIENRQNTDSLLPSLPKSLFRSSKGTTAGDKGLGFLSELEASQLGRREPEQF